MKLTFYILKLFSGPNPDVILADYTFLDKNREINSQFSGGYYFLATNIAPIFFPFKTTAITEPSLNTLVLQ